MSTHVIQVLPGLRQLTLYIIREARYQKRELFQPRLLEYNFGIY